MIRISHKEFAPLSEEERARLEAAVTKVATAFAPVQGRVYRGYAVKIWHGPGPGIDRQCLCNETSGEIDSGHTRAGKRPMVQR